MLQNVNRPFAERNSILNIVSFLEAKVQSIRSSVLYVYTILNVNSQESIR